MRTPVPLHILDRLTDVDMVRLKAGPEASGSLDLDGMAVPLHHAASIVIGSGAAGLRAAVELKRRGVDVAILSQNAWGGTSACSGSDKQTLHTANTSGRGDDIIAMAEAIGAGGAMDEDTAYVEAVGSSRALASLHYLGLALPQDRLGGTLRYRTDHDEAGRATSCGPRTSRLMVQVLAKEALRLDIPFFNHTTAVRILKKDARAIGVLAMRPRRQDADNPLGLAVFMAPTLVIAAGGPGELYRDSTYPHHCFGALGLALEAGLDLVNLTESQFGIGTRREGFAWNLSGTYVQAIPHVYSLDEGGNEHHFLADYYRTTRELASNIFRKGYQWPFHAARMLDYGSSLFDLAVWREGEAGRKVLMDFNRNPSAVPGDAPFSLERLDEDVGAYLGAAGADQGLPIDRLSHMNPLAIELYRRSKRDIAKEPLEFSVNNQHMNGGIAVDVWGRTTLEGCYAVGEAAGTHGATRPGGAALNAGQVFGTRVAEHIAARAGGADHPPARADSLKPEIAALLSILKPHSGLTVDRVRREVQARMSEHAGPICRAKEVSAALRQARDLNARIRRDGLSFPRAHHALRAIQWQQMARASEAVLAALDHYIADGGGSRGARAICAGDGEATPAARALDLAAFRFRNERDADRREQLLVRLEGDEIVVRPRPIRAFDASSRPFFERDWPDFLTGRIFNSGDGAS